MSYKTTILVVTNGKKGLQTTALSLLENFLKQTCKAKNKYIDLYTEAQQIIKDHAAPVMNEVRDKAFDDFRRLGFPSKKVERYKYTDMQSYLNQIMV